MGTGFDFTAITRGISDSLSGIMSFRFGMPGTVDFGIPLWLVLVIAGSAFFIATNLIRKRQVINKKTA